MDLRAGAVLFIPTVQPFETESGSARLPPSFVVGPIKLGGSLALPYSHSLKCTLNAWSKLLCIAIQ